jgi:hypothetical protein
MLSYAKGITPQWKEQMSRNCVLCFKKGLINNIYYIPFLGMRPPFRDALVTQCFFNHRLTDRIFS